MKNDIQFDNVAGLLDGFPYRSYHHTLLILNCSKFFLEKLVRNGIVQKHYFEFKDGKGCGKPYFLLSELTEALSAGAKPTGE